MMNELTYIIALILVLFLSNMGTLALIHIGWEDISPLVAVVISAFIVTSLFLIIIEGVPQ